MQEVCEMVFLGGLLVPNHNLVCISYTENDSEYKFSMHDRDHGLSITDPYANTLIKWCEMTPELT